MGKGDTIRPTDPQKYAEGYQRTFGTFRAAREPAPLAMTAPTSSAELPREPEALLRQRVRDLEYAITRYGRHDSGCPGHPCDCGYGPLARLSHA